MDHGVCELRDDLGSPLAIDTISGKRGVALFGLGVGVGFSFRDCLCV
jgi:hypothetical protein